MGLWVETENREVSLVFPQKVSLTLTLVKLRNMVLQKMKQLKV